MLTVVIIAVLIFSLIPPFGIGPAIDLGLRVLSRILLIPIVAGIAYEFLRFTASRQDQPLVRLITRPNLALQRLTTREPDHEMLAVAIAAFEEVRRVDIARERMDGEPLIESEEATSTTEFS